MKTATSTPTKSFALEPPSCLRKLALYRKRFAEAGAPPTTSNPSMTRRNFHLRATAIYATTVQEQRLVPRARNRIAN
jgi:hypothetical protein